MKSFLAFFARRHILSNFILIAVFVGGYVLWHRTSKEEMPDFTFNRVSISVSYPGSTSEEVEYFVILPMEEVLRGMEGVEEITSNASPGRANVNVYLQQNLDNMPEIVADIRSAVLEVDLPDEITDIPSIRQFKTSAKAIIDIALYDTTVHLFTAEDRVRIQQLALALESRLLTLPEITSVNRRGYLREELQIQADPGRLRYFRIPLNSMNSQIRAYNQRRPAGAMSDADESQVTVAAELKNPEQFNPLIIQGGFEGQVVRVRDVATVKRSFEEDRSILKVNGYQAVMLNAVKSSTVGIITSVEAVKEAVAAFENSTLSGSSVRVALLDDESRNVRSRLELISINGVIGLALIIILLFLFLNPQSGFWAALGIPFCFGATMIMAHMVGYTINNMTLAAVIIVMGMIVDDAIVVAENITRLRRQGVAPEEAAIEGTRFVAIPIIAAVVTTCVAFLPLLFIEDRFGQLIRVIPPIITFMLMASLFESLLILPGHMHLRLPRPFLWIATLGTLPLWERAGGIQKKHWFDHVEEFYGKALAVLLKGKWLVFPLCILLLFSALRLFKKEMRFVLFPNEETTQIRCRVEAPPETRSSRTAEMTLAIDSVLRPYIGNEVIGYRTQIAQSRWGRSARENTASMRIEIVPAEKRRKSARQLMTEWEKALGDSTSHGFRKLRFSTTRFGQSSGSSVELLISENNNDLRNALADTIALALREFPSLREIEIDRPLLTPEYMIGIKRETAFRLGINPADIGLTLRTILEGAILYEFPTDDEEVRVILTADDESKRSVQSLLRIPVENRGNYLVPLSEVVEVRKSISQASIDRENFRRITRVVADIKPGIEITPLEIAATLEDSLFPAIMQAHPTTHLSFTGEIEDSRESQGTFRIAVYVVLGLIFAVLALVFNSLAKPFIIMATIPFAVVGVIYAFHWHGMDQYGLFAMVGVLGLMGVVINDSIVMLVKLSYETKRQVSGPVNQHVAKVAKTRLRAVLLTTLTTVAGLFPTAYGVAGFDAMLTEMMLAMGWGLIFGTIITLVLVPSVYASALQLGRIGRTGRSEEHAS